MPLSFGWDLFKSFVYFFKCRYLDGDQISSIPRPEACIASIMKGARLIECKKLIKIYIVFTYILDKGYSI